MTKRVNIYSQRLQDLGPLGDGGETGVSRKRDEIGGQVVVFKKNATALPENQREVETVIRLSRQLGESGFLAAQDVIVEGDRISGYTFPLIEPGNLNETAGNLDNKDLLTVFQSVCQALAYLHSLDYLHCDIKPANILVERTDDGVRSYVIDLGFAVRRGSQFVTTIQGTHAYIAPEHKQGKPLTEAADVFSFGTLLGRVAGVMRGTHLVAAIEALGRECADAEPTRRPQSFWDIHESLRRLSDAEFGPVRNEVLAPPLRDAGVRLRVNNLKRHIEDSERQWRGLCLIAGMAGVGKSKIMREFVFERQIAGDETVRITQLRSLGDLIDLLNSRLKKPRAARAANPPLLWITAETSPDGVFAPDDLLRLHSAACGRQAVVLLEHRGPLTALPSDEIRSVWLKPFSLRECIVASSHLQNDPSVSSVNGQALLLATAGNPWLLRKCLRVRLANPRREHGDEPVNFDCLDAPVMAFWKRDFDMLSPPLRVFLEHASIFHAEFAPGWLAGSGIPPGELARQAEVLVGAGWLRQTDTADEPPGRCQFACRTARNFVRRQCRAADLQSRAAIFLTSLRPDDRANTPSLCSLWELRRIAGRHDGKPDGKALWETRRDLDDVKLATLALLTEYRRLRVTGDGKLSSRAAAISDGFAELGSVRRRKRWAAVASDQMQTPARGSNLSIVDVRFLCHLHELSGDKKSKKTALTTLLEGDGITDAFVKGYLLSELGNVYLYESRWKEANDHYLQAHHLLERAAPESAEYVRNLNRVGLTLMRTGHHGAARKRLELCRKLAGQFGYTHIARLSLGNLAILERDMGDPQAAMRFSRGALGSYRSAHDTLGYLRALPDRVMCLVDLGQGYLAARTAHLAVWLASLYSAKLELSHAQNNLGWILMMQGATGTAYEQLQAAVRLHARTGNSLWIMRSKLNLAWMFLLAGDLERAEDHCRSGLHEFEMQDDLHGRCEARRILAQAAIMKEDLQAAEDHLTQIPRDNPLLSPRDQTETALAWLNLCLWRGELVESERLIDDLANNPIVENVHPMRCDFGRMRGMLYTLQGRYDRSLDTLMATASECRRGGRIDKLIDTMIALVFLAQRMHNWSVGRGYLQTVTKLTEAMRLQLPHDTTRALA